MIARAPGPAAGRSAVHERGPDVVVTQLDLDGPDGPLTGPPRTTDVLALVRLHRHPLGVVGVRVAAECSISVALRRAALLELGQAVLEHERFDRSLGPAPWLPEPDGPVPPCLRRRAALLDDPPPISVIIGTRGRPDRLARCLGSLAVVDYPRFEVLVIDQDPETDVTRRIVRHAAGPVRYLRQRRAGRSAAHDLGAAEATGRLLAFTDDDVEVDRDWLPAIAESFADRRVGCVAGLIMPGAFSAAGGDGGNDAGRGNDGGGPAGRADRVPRCTPLAFESGAGYEPGADDGVGRAPFRLPAWRTASGANVAFDADVLAELRSFDPFRAERGHVRSGGDLSKTLRSISTGSRVVYQPDAVVWDQHHRQPLGTANIALSA